MVKFKPKRPLFHTIDYVGFGYVKFPYRKTDFYDLRAGITVVRLVLIDPSKDFSDGRGAKDFPVFDDAFIGLDSIKEGDSALRFLISHTRNIYSTYLLGHMNWVGRKGSTEYWKCLPEDLLNEGKSVYEEMCTGSTHLALIVTSLCQKKETIRHLMLETEVVGLPKMSSERLALD